MLIGYARISTTDQTLALQKDALEKAGCEKIFTDTVSGTKTERIGLSEALSHLRDCLVKVRVKPFVALWRTRRTYLMALFGGNASRKLRKLPRHMLT
jgi:hypothetical protein